VPEEELTMRPTFGTDLTSFLGVAIGAAAGVALTAALSRGAPAPVSHEVHQEGDHSISVHVVPRRKVWLESDVVIQSKLLEAEVETERARLEAGKMHLQLEPRIRVERERVERRR
jgi:hypothetical protein